MPFSAPYSAPVSAAPNWWRLDKPTESARSFRVWIFVVLTGLGYAAPASGWGQVDRWELGKRLQRMERAWAASSPAKRRVAVEPLQLAVRRFFSLQLPQAARALDVAWFAVRDLPEPTPFQRQAVGWRVTLTPLVSASSDAPVQLSLASYYVEPPELPADTRLEWSIVAADQATLAQGVLPWPAAVAGWQATIPPERSGDFELRATLRSGADHLDLLPHSFSRIERWEARLAELEQRTADPAWDPSDSLRATVREWTAWLQQGSQNDPQEIDLPAAWLLDLAERVTGPNVDRPRLIREAATAHDMWLTVARGRKQVRLRVRAPQGDGPFPVLFLLHGAGGSENMFFETYGAGAAVRNGCERGWIVVAPRQGWGGLALDGPALLDELAEFFPVARDRVFWLGHSMGAAEVVAQVGRHPEVCRSAAILGGGGRLSAEQAAAVASLPWFIAAGELDFGRSGAEALQRRLQAAGASQLRYREYADTEHLVIVQAALPDVFAFWDELLKSTQSPAQH